MLLDRPAERVPCGRGGPSELHDSGARDGPPLPHGAGV